MRGHDTSRRRGAILDDSGYATIASSGIIIAAVSLLLVVAAVVSRVVALHEAQVAADMAAISGAFAHARGEDGCAEASHLATANGAHLATCHVIDSDVQVAVSVRMRTASAQAGPV